MSPVFFLKYITFFRKRKVLNLFIFKSLNIRYNELQIMGRLISFMVFFLVFSGVMFGIHYFIFQVISKNLSLSIKTLQWIKWIFILSAASIIAGQMLSRMLNVHFVQDYGYIWLGLISITFAVFLVASLVKVIIPSGSEIIVVSAIVISLLISIYSFINNMKEPVLREIEIETTKSIGGTGEYKILQLSDVHIDESTDPEAIKKIVEKVNELSPDLIVITGDLIDGRINEKSSINLILKKLKSNDGVYAITGNHEYYSGIDNFLAFTSRTGIKVLFNEYIDLTENISLYGMKDETSSSSGSSDWTADVLDIVNKDKFNILIGHRPYGIEKNGEKGIDLQMAGHTHAGQIPPMDLLVHLVYRYPSGLYRSANSFIYTSSGTGVWGPPMRFLSNSEIVLYKITQGKKISGRISK